MMRSRVAAIGAVLYLLAFAGAAAYPLFDHRIFSNVAVVMLALPWIDYFPTLLGAAALNALIIYLLLTAIAGWISRSRDPPIR